jgi:L-lactate dehydrogenase complex protein LldE
MDRSLRVMAQENRISPIVKVQLFITCLAEQFFPGVLEKMVVLFEQLGIEPVFPAEQTCCGQPFFNSGLQTEARKMAISWMETFNRLELPIVSPSGSCVDMVCHHYPNLFPENSAEHRLALSLSKRTFEFSQFLVQHLRITNVGAFFPHRVTYHASCHLLRGLGCKDEPKMLLQNVRGLQYIPLEDEDTCCGFGGSFSIIYPEVSRAMMQQKIRHIQNAGVEAVVACDAGCLMNIAGGLSREGSPIRALHLIDVLASRENER